MEHWYALYTTPNSEYQVEEVLRQYRIQTYLPETELPISYSSGRARRPFFPCYLFMRVNFEEIGVSQLQWTPGLRQIVTFGEYPLALPAEVISLLQQKLGDVETNGHDPILSFQPGETVRIIDGPFQDMVAIFDGPTTPAKRVQVLLEIFGNISRVQVDAAVLEKTTRPEAGPRLNYSRRTRGRGRRINYQH